MKRREAPPPPSAPPLSSSSSSSDPTNSGGSKAIDWSLNSTPQPHDTKRPPEYPPQPHDTKRPPEYPSETPPYPGPTTDPAPQYPGTAFGAKQPFHQAPQPLQPQPRQPATNPYELWRVEFGRQYPGSRFSRDSPSLMKVEIPKNRAFPAMGAASCPECFDSGPHQPTVHRIKTGFFSYSKEQAQQCRRCRKTAYFVRSDAVVPDEPPRNLPPPYTNSPLAVHRGGNRADLGPGHGWPSGLAGPGEDDGHGWNPGDNSGHGWR